MTGTPSLREWQAEALTQVKALWREGGSKPLIAACPGAGKTWFSVVASQFAIKEHGIQLVLIVSPTVNIKSQWKTTFETAGIEAHHKADNEALRFRRDGNHDILEGRRAICVTYSQLAKDIGLFEYITVKYPTLMIADEIHHADDNESFGKAISSISDVCKLRLSLSGTPFNTSGGSLAMCDTKIEYDEDGKKIRRAVPVYSYEYSNAIAHNVCRPVEFINILGKGTTTYKNLASDQVYQKVIDLARENKTDVIGPLLDPAGAFFEKMVTESLTALASIKKTDSRAGMLVVCRNVEHGGHTAQVIKNIMRKSPEWSAYSVTEIYNDTHGAHARIEHLDADSTDIIVTVKMISEGIDVKRLRVGLYATDYRTRMFFIQFIGRFIRWETRLDGTQYAKVIIPGHIDLIEYAREIELMVDSALISEPGGDGGEEKEVQNICLGTETEAGRDGLIYRGEEESERMLRQAFFEQYPNLVGHVPEFLAAQAARDANMKGAQHYEKKKKETDWGAKNDGMVNAIVRIMRLNGDDDKTQFAKVQAFANRAVGIPRKDKMTPIETLKKRHSILREWYVSMRSGKDWSEIYG